MMKRKKILFACKTVNEMGRFALCLQSWCFERRAEDTRFDALGLILDLWFRVADHCVQASNYDGDRWLKGLLHSVTADDQKSFFCPTIGDWTDYCKEK